MINVEKTYIIHYTKLIDRKNKIENFFNSIEYKNYFYITKYDKEDLTDDIISEFYYNSKEEYDKKIKPIYKNGVEFRQLSLAEISCTIKHYSAIKNIAEECRDYGFIIEDDILPVANFKNNFNKYLEKTPNDWDVIFMGNCCQLRISDSMNSEGKIAWLKENPASKCADAYLIKTDAAKKISHTMKKFTTISDWELSYQFVLNNIKVYWWEPALVCQGSELGVFKSTLR